MSRFARRLALLVVAISCAFGVPACAAIWGFQDLEQGGDASVPLLDGEPSPALDSTLADGKGDGATQNSSHDASVRDVVNLTDMHAPPSPDGSPPDTGMFFDGGCAVCDARCVFLQNDPSNCGTCERMCPAGDSCQDGVCTCPGQQSMCTPAGETTPVCVDETSDHGNCGGCGNACPTNATCLNGACTCPGDFIVCETECVEPTNDANNCGKCGMKCPSGTTCQDGTCTCTQANNLYCSQGCTNILYDPNNCNECSHVCPSGVTCQPGTDGGICTCVNATSMCPVNGTMTCVNLTSDPNHCGSCANACPSGGKCANGSCAGCLAIGTDVVAQCATGGPCLDLTTNPQYCGTCNTQCPAAASCSGGHCICPSGLSVCGSACVNLTNDNGNCGSCGTTCPTGSSCQSSHCVCGAGLSLCNGACVDETTNPNDCGGCALACTAGNAMWTCEPSVTTGMGACAVTSCDTNYGNCDGNPGNGCEANLLTDSNNCGSCGRQCPLDASCNMGACMCPTGTPALCSGVCVNTNSDNANCGSCGAACGALQQCISGICQCTATLCSSGCCNGSTCELFASQTVTSCGAGGAMCGKCPFSSSGETCASVSNGGMCTCPAGLVPCGNGCTDVTVDVNNCGGCGNVCDSGLCTAGLCATPPPPPPPDAGIDASIDAGM